jgi:hypothetical protein
LNWRGPLGRISIISRFLDVFGRYFLRAFLLSFHSRANLEKSIIPMQPQGISLGHFREIVWVIQVPIVCLTNGAGPSIVNTKQSV